MRSVLTPANLGTLFNSIRTLALATALAIAAPARSEELAFNATSNVTDPKLEEHFRTPPPGARPWVFWMWLRADTTFEAITKDLEEMHAKGIEGAILYDAGHTTLSQNRSKMVLEEKGYRMVPTQDFRGGYDTPLPTGPVAPWGDRVRELLRFASKEAGRIGVKLCLSVGLAGTSGPIEPQYGQQNLLWSETSVTGPVSFDDVLPVPAEAVSPVLVPAAAKKAQRAGPVPGKSGTPFTGTEVAVLAVPDRNGFDVSEVVNLSKKMDAAGRLRWTAPAGQWKILRFGYAPTGKGDVWGLFTDAMSKEALEKTWDVTLGRMLKEMTPAERQGLVAVEDDSWESGVTTWTRRFPTEFQRLRGYDLIPWLPVLAGSSVGQPDAAQGVKRDFYRTIADLIAENHYGHLRTIAHQSGFTFYSEAAGPNTSQLDALQNCGAVDVAMGEFWMPSPHRPTPDRRFMLRMAANANHLYGKRLTACESFTSVGPHWEDTFFEMKNSADQAFADGCNQNVIHCFSQSPSVNAKPGYVYFAGTHYTRQMTWWNQTPAFNLYLGRCCYLLQQGLFVADALYYRGDGIGLIEQRKTKPALPGEGYDHDNLNLHALLTRVSVKDARLVLPDGMSYRILVLPNDAPMAPAALEKIAALVKGGAVVVGPRPRGMAGLPTTADEQKKFDARCAQLWKTGVEENRIGAGRVIASREPREVLATLGVAPDFEYTGLSKGGELDWIHRTAGETDIYFVASLWDPVETVNCTFRVSGKQPELWNPVTGEIRAAAAFTQKDGRTTVPLRFNPRESVFVIFRKPTTSGVAGTATSNYPTLKVQRAVEGPWEVAFDPKWGGPAKTVFDVLTDWTKRPEEGIKHYSGTAVYRKKLTVSALPTAGEKLLLDLGEVREIASVRLNGTDLGVLWTRPARVDITKVARVGENDLEVNVVNLWPNRLIGDESLPKEQRLTETNIHKFTAATPLYPSGLLGPVTLQLAIP